MSDKVKYELEFPIHASTSMLYNYISTPSGLSEWFADNVNSRGELFTFIWDGSEEQAKLLSKKKVGREKIKKVNQIILKLLMIIMLWRLKVCIRKVL